MGALNGETHPARWSGLKRAYALEGTRDQVAVVRADASGQGVQTTIIYEGPADMELEAWRRVLRDITAEQESGLSLVSVAAPATRGFVVPLSTPLTSQSKALRVMPGLLDLELPFPVEQCRYSLLDPHANGTGGVQALAVGARESDIRDLYVFWEELKVQPSLMDQEGLVLWDAWRKESPDSDPDAYQALMHFHSDRTTILFGSSQHLHAVRSLRHGSDSDARLFEPAMLRLLRGQEEVLIPKSVWISGSVGDARFQDLHRLLHEEQWPSPKRLKAPRQLFQRGLARRALEPGPFSLDMLTEAEQPASLTRLWHRKRQHAGLLGVACGLLCFLGAFMLQQAAQGRLDKMNQALRSRAAAISGMSEGAIPKGQELLMVTRALDVQGGGGAPVLAVLQPPLSSLAEDLTVLADKKGIAFQSMQLTPTSLELRGQAPTWPAIEEYQKELSGRGRHLELQRVQGGSATKAGFVLSERRGP